VHPRYQNADSCKTLHPLRARRERPPGRAAEQRDELAPSYTESLKL
jgi:hypothetical protein